MAYPPLRSSVAEGDALAGVPVPGRRYPLALQPAHRRVLRLDLHEAGVVSRLLELGVDLAWLLSYFKNWKSCK